MNHKPTLIAFILANTIEANTDGYLIQDAATTFRTNTKPLFVDFSAFTCLTNIRIDTKIFLSLATADETSGGHPNQIGTFIADDTLAQVSLVSHHPRTPFPKYGKYVARLHANDDIIAQFKFSLEPPLT